MADFEGNVNLDVEASEIETSGKFKLTDEELNRVSGGYIPTTSDPDLPSHYKVVNLYMCYSCEWRGGAPVEDGVPSICPVCGAVGEIVVHDTDTILDDDDLKTLLAWWTRPR